MRQSLKTRLLSAAYKAACAFAEKVFAFTESIREKKDSSYLDDLYDHRDALEDELREGEELAHAQRRRNEYVARELAVTEREIYGPDYTPTCTLHKVRDFDDLPPPQGMVEIDLDPIKYVDEDEAPAGYKAVLSSGGCTGCAFDPLGTCPGSSGSALPSCFADQRGDRQEVVFVKQ